MLKRYPTTGCHSRSRPRRIESQVSSPNGEDAGLSADTTYRAPWCVTDSAGSSGLHTMPEAIFGKK